MKTKTTTRTTTVLPRDRQRPRTPRRTCADFLALCVYPGMRPPPPTALQSTDLNGFFAVGPTEPPGAVAALR